VGASIRAWAWWHDLLGVAGLGCRDEGRCREPLRDQEEPEASEPGWHLLWMAVEDACHRWKVVVPDGEHASVVVTPLPLDDAEVPLERFALVPPGLLNGV
jgi:hypothetical protein